MALAPMPCRDRQSGRLEDEPVFGEGALGFFYEHPLGKRLFAAALSRPWFSRLYGAWQDLPGSRRRIGPFIEAYGVAMDEVETPPGGFASFNAFFTRTLKPGARPFPADPTLLASPADGRVLVHPALGPEAALTIKGVSLPLSALLGSPEAAARYAGGAVVVVRLAVQDTHRFHFPFDAVAGPAAFIAGRLHSVGPQALRAVPDLYLRNQRAVTMLDAPGWGRVAYVEVGALTVGRIRQTYEPGPVTAGQEKGYFAFGGSTLVLAFEPGRVQLDADLLQDSEAGVEVKVRAGEPLGRRTP